MVSLEKLLNLSYLNQFIEITLGKKDLTTEVILETTRYMKVKDSDFLEQYKNKKVIGFKTFSLSNGINVLSILITEQDVENGI